MFAVCLIQVLALSVGGVILGLVVGATLPLVGADLLAPILPVPPVLGIYPRPLLLAAGYGLLVALCFALWPLGRASRIPGGALFRDGLMPERTQPSVGVVVTNAALAFGLIGLAVVSAADRAFAFYFCVGAVLTLGLFRASALALMHLARLVPPFRWPSVRLGINNLHRPGTPTPLLLLSTGLGLSTLAAVALIQGNMQLQIQEQLPANAPSFFLYRYPKRPTLGF